MAAAARQHAIDIQDHDTPASLDPAPAEKPLGRCCKAMLWLLLAFVIALFVMAITLAVLEGDPAEYSVAIAAGAPESGAAASPAPFNLTVHIKNPSKVSTAFVWSDAAAMVSYGGATIGAGVVPWFCAGKREERQAVVPVWGVGAGANVTLPRALQSQGAVVDVSVRMQSSGVCSHHYPRVLSGSVKVGGGLTLCTSACD